MNPGTGDRNVPAPGHAALAHAVNAEGLVEAGGFSRSRRRAGNASEGEDKSCCGLHGFEKKEC